MMVRYANAQIQVYHRDQLMKRQAALADAPRLEIDPSKLYLIITALTIEQEGPATPSERKLYGRDSVYFGNQNADFFEGARSVMWKCASCNKPFLKYPENTKCVYCGSEHIHDWEADIFGKKGELFTRNASGKYAYESWLGAPVHINHVDTETIGTIEDVWPEIAEKKIAELLSINRRTHERIARKVEAGQVTDTSMGVLVGSSVCSICANVAETESNWCSCLKNYKGRVHPQTGRRVFEILKNCQGCEQSLIISGYGADSTAKIRAVVAGASLPSSTFLAEEEHAHDMAKPQINLPKADRKVLKTVASAANLHGAPGGGGSGDGRPDLSGAFQQLHQFGDFDSSRTASVAGAAVSAAVDAMTPKNPGQIRRQILSMIGQLEQSDPQAAQEMRGRLQASAKPWKLQAQQIKAALAPLAKMIGGIRVAQAVRSLSNPDRARQLVTPQNGKRTGALQLAQSGLLGDPTQDQAERLVAGAVTDALLDAAEQLGHEIQMLAQDSVAEAAGEMTGSDQDIQSLGTELEQTFDDENVREIPDEGAATVITVVADEDEPSADSGENRDKPTTTEVVDYQQERIAMNRKSQVNAEPNTENRDSNPESFPTKAKDATRKPNKIDRMEDSRRPQPENVPASEDGAKHDPEMSAKVTAQKNPDEPNVAKPDPAAKGKAENFPKPLEEPQVDLDTRSTDTEDMDKPKAQPAGAELNKKPLPAEKNIKAEDTPASQLDAEDASEGPNTEPMATPAGVKAETFPMKAIASLPLDRRMAMASDPKCPARIRAALKRDANADVRYLAAQLSDPTYPDAESLKGKDGKTKMMDAESPVDEKGENSLTTPSDESPNSLQGGDQVTKPGAVPFPNEAVGGEEITKPNSVDFPNEAVDGEKATTSSDEYPDKLSQDASKVTAALIVNKQPGKRSASYWEVRLAKAPVMRVTAKTAFGDQVIDSWSEFTAPEYGQLLRSEVLRRGIKATNQAHFGGEAQVFKRTAQMTQPGMAPNTATPGGVTPSAPAAPAAQPTAQPGPANMDAGVTQDLMAQSPDQAPLTTVLAKVTAPIAAAEQFTDLQGWVANLVQLFSDQDKVTEFTTKLEKEVSDLSPTDNETAAPGAEGAPMQAPDLVPSTGPMPAPENRAMVGASAKRQAKLTSEEEAYFRKAYPEGYGSELVSTANKTDDGKRSASDLQRENTLLKQERSALLRADRAMDIARKAQACGEIASAKDFAAQGLTESKARQASKMEREAEAKRLLELDDKGFDYVAQRVETRYAKHAAELSKEPVIKERLTVGIANQTDDSDLMTSPSDPMPRLAMAFKSAVDTEAYDQAMAEGPTRRRNHR